MPVASSRRAVLLSVLLAVGLIGASLAVFDPFYTSDGAVMTMIASGTGLALEPDEHLVFTNVLLGRLLAGLYRRAPGIPWYGLHLFTVQVVAWIGLFYAALAQGATAQRALMCTLTFGVVGLSFLVNLQFSSTAFLAAAAGGCLWVQICSPRWDREVPGAAAGAVALMVLGSLVRFDAFLLSFALAVPAAALATARRQFTRRWLAIGLATFALAFAAQAYDTRAYRQHPGWREFRDFIPLLPEITDYGRAAVLDDELAPALRQVGWSENDHRLFMQWFHADPDVYGAQALRQLLSTAPALEDPFRRLWNGTLRLGRIVRNPAVWAMLLALPCLLLWRGRPTRRRDLAIVLGLLGAAAAATVALAAFRKAPPQVYLPLFSFALCVALVSGGPTAPLTKPHSGARGRRLAEAAMACAAGAGLILSVHLQHQEGRLEKERARQLWSQFAPLTRSSHQLIVAWVDAFPHQIVRPLEPTTHLESLRLFSLGWSQRTPLAREMLVSFGSSDFLQVLTDPRTVFLGPPAATQLLARYAEEHRGLRLVFRDLELQPLTAFRARVRPRGAQRSEQP